MLDFFNKMFEQEMVIIWKMRKRLMLACGMI
jgi:hypothetical protein